jgi:hypothetical protein
MHIQTHILSGWCVGNLFSLTARERMFCMIAAAAADVDGLGRVISEEMYWDYHHKLGHGAAFGVLMAVMLASFSTHRARSCAVYLALFHLHLVLDYFGSGPGWPIFYLWPLSSREWVNPHAWEFFSWQNIGAAVALIAWTVWIAVRQRRTPLEVLMPSLDRKAIAWMHGMRADRTEDVSENCVPGRGPQEPVAAPAPAGGDRSP